MPLSQYWDDDYEDTAPLSSKFKKLKTDVVALDTQPRRNKDATATVITENPWRQEKRSCTQEPSSQKVEVAILDLLTQGLPHQSYGVDISQISPVKPNFDKKIDDPQTLIIDQHGLTHYFTPAAIP